VSDEIIRTARLTKRFRGKTAVREVSLAVDRGSVYAFLGPNGAGKSTTIRMLLGLLRPDDGDVALFGAPLNANRYSALARTGSLVENPSVYPHLTASENLNITRLILGAPKSDIARVLDIVGLGYASTKLVRTFSLGMKQRLGLAQAMLGRRELLVLDEPTNGLDPAGIQEMRQLIRRLPPEFGITVFLSSHLLGEVEQVATHVGILSQGQLVFQGTAKDVSALRRPRLRIRVPRADAARAHLSERGWAAELVANELLLGDTTVAAAVNRSLVEAGFDVELLALESASLEDIFLGMTQAEVA
jgi:ABC-2 type transport system ATP-binding protein